MGCDKPYVCVSSSKNLDEEDVHICSCGKKTCADCGGDVVTLKEFIEAMKENSNED